MTVPLPSKSDCVRTLAWVNTARAALGQRPRKYLPFAGCTPADSQRCLLADALNTNARGAYVAYSCDPLCASIGDLPDPKGFATATRTTLDQYGDSVIVPLYVHRVVHAFDHRVEGLRERLRDAGVVR